MTALLMFLATLPVGGVFIVLTEYVYRRVQDGDA